MGRTRLAENTKNWETMKIKQNFWPAALKFADRALVHKADYQHIASLIKQEYDLYIPWWFIPLVHERECVRGVDNWSCNIAQGCRFDVKCNVIPKNGPFSSFDKAAIAALVLEHPFAAKNTNWSGGGTMTIAEDYNGTGYYRMGVTNPYLFSGTDKYVKGKYIADHKYDANKVDTQLGVAISLKALMERDSSITLDGNMPNQDKAPNGVEKVASGGLPALILAFINTNPWFIFTWWDIAGIAAATVVVTGVAIAAIKWWRRKYDR